MNREALDTEYHDLWDAHGAAAVQATCGAWSGRDQELFCARPTGHGGDHAAIIGLDPDTNDWHRWESATVAG